METTDIIEDRAARPRSAAHPIVGLIGLASLLAALAAVARWNPADRTLALLCLVLAVGVPMLAAEAYLNWPQLSRRSLAAPNAARIAIKTIGLIATLATIAIAYWAFPIYRDEQASVLLSLLGYCGAPLLVLTLPYIWLTDRLMEKPEDGLYMAGLAVLGQWNDIDPTLLRQYALGWLVKAFFLPLMLWNSWANLDLLQSPLAAIGKPPYGWYEFSYNMIFFIDVLFASAGYCCTLRLFDIHIRRSEDKVWGWVVCIGCYAPFWGVIGKEYLPYSEGDHGWGYWFGPATVLGSVWAAMILVVLASHVSATVIFGIRFSNLTNRGIITGGPYRWSKHPAYCTKMLLYMMIWLPFLNPISLADAARHTLLFLCLVSIYYARAKSEEAYLMQDAAYRAYADFIREKGLVAVARRRLAKLVSLSLPGRAHGPAASAPADRA